MNSSDSIAVRAASLDDIFGLASLFDDYRCFYQESPAPLQTLAFVRELLSTERTRFFVAVTQATHAPLGFVHLIPSFNTLAMRRIWYLEDLFVHPDARRKGVARALMAYAERFARTDNAERVTLATARDNFPAQELYRQLGYLRDEFFEYFHLRLP